MCDMLIVDQAFQLYRPFHGPKIKIFGYVECVLKNDDVPDI